MAAVMRMRNAGEAGAGAGAGAGIGTGAERPDRTYEGRSTRGGLQSVRLSMESKTQAGRYPHRCGNLDQFLQGGARSWSLIDRELSADWLGLPYWGWQFEALLAVGRCLGLGRLGREATRRLTWW